MIEPVLSVPRSMSAASRQPMEVQAKVSMSASPVSGEAGVETELHSDRLFGRTRRLVIVHHGERYCLQVTRAGKLLLTK
ncbi:hemin uptake protein HemP [Nevskia ramosa]|uniref:hemin uptake protein HemP n=1 Tax=Nevskia ramosa TaxID=64002 RepID=UPI003D0ED280